MFIFRHRRTGNNRRASVSGRSRHAATDPTTDRQAENRGRGRAATDATITGFFNDSSFGVPSDQVASVISPRSQDRLWLMDLFRHIGRGMLLSTLKQAAATPGSTVYPGDDSGCSAGDQWCADSIVQRPLGGVTDDRISWQNRPTFQQVVEFPSHR